MIEVLKSRNCKNMDREAIENYGILSILLMENAARGVFEKIHKKGSSFLVLCGKGNNGGDGLAVARHLITSGKKVKVYIISRKDNYTEDFKINLNILKKISDEENICFLKEADSKFIEDLKNYDVAVDCILGVGISRDVEKWLQEIIDNVNIYSKFKVSVDVPSGLDCDCGIPRGAAIEADETYTFEVIKRGFLNYKSFDYIGKLNIVNIGIPGEVKRKHSENIYKLEKEDYKKIPLKRKVYGHKGDFGRALVIAGSEGFTGAAYICTEAAVRTGAGLVTLACTKEIKKILQSRLTEAMTVSTEDEKTIELIKKADVIAFGPGFGTGEKELKYLEKVINESTCPIVIDADGITLLSKNPKLLKKLNGRAVLTPHPGEMARLLNISVKEVEENRIEKANEIAAKYNITVLLKGYNTIISDGKQIFVNPSGNSRMASGGMGDALTGIIASFIAQGLNILNSALLGAYIHGYAGDRLGEQRYIINARDVIESVPYVLNEFVYD